MYPLRYLVFLQFAGAPAAQSLYAIKETHKVPPGWTEAGEAAKDHIISLQIGLSPSNKNALEEYLIEISDPTHYRYKQHLSIDEVATLIRPSNETQELVESWLRDHGIWQFTWNEPARDWISTDLTIAQVEGLLQTKYSEYIHPESSAAVLRTAQYSLPKHLHEHVDLVQPTTSFFGAALASRQDKNASIAERGDILEERSSEDSISIACKGLKVTPNCIRTLYGSIDYKPQVPGKNKIGITNYLNQSSHRGDIEKFLTKYRPEAASAAHEFDIVIINNAENHQGPYNKSDPDYSLINAEGDLDAELVLSLTWPTLFTAYNTGGFSPNGVKLGNEPFLTWLNYMQTQTNIPQVISSSYSDDEDTVPESYARRVCSGFAQLGARGVSVLVSSGDNGVAGRDGTCNGKQFVPRFPATCPWITVVGGTREYEPETAWYNSGGGFSNYFTRPDYQTEAIPKYTKSLKGKYNGRYNKTGRAYPDVAAQGELLATAQGGGLGYADGTSGSAPIFASIISLVNDALIAKGKAPLGFLNPWLYGGAHDALTDILTSADGGNGGCKTKGFPVQKGWDAVTGWGTPNFKTLVESALTK